MAARPRPEESSIRISKPMVRKQAYWRIGVLHPGVPSLVQSWQFRGEDSVQVSVGIAANGGVIRVETDVHEIVVTRKEAHPGEHAHPVTQAKRGRSALPLMIP